MFKVEQANADWVAKVLDKQYSRMLTVFASPFFETGFM